MWENQLGRGRPFWTFAFPIVRDIFPEQFGGLDVKAVYRAANTVMPSLIRVQADEVIYLLHVILRFEIERDLVEGDLLPANVPEVCVRTGSPYLDERVS